jgi:hypothetical protein
MWADTRCAHARALAPTAIEEGSMRTLLTPVLVISVALASAVLAAPSAFAQAAGSEEEAQSPSAQSQIEILQRQLGELRKEYSEKISELEQKIERLEVQRAAEQAAGPLAEAESTERSSEETVFESGALGLQALNPEISVVADMVSWYGETEGERRRSNFDPRVLGVHFESYLDPYSKLKACVPVNKGSAQLGEMYLTRYDAGKNLNLTLGKFNQQFGVVNRWHVPSLDQVEFPLALRQIFAGNLNQTGLSFDWLLPGSGSKSQGLTLQVTNGENSRVFGANASNFPSALVHYKNYRDLSKDKYLEAGLTALVGRNDQWQVRSAEGSALTQNRDLWTWVLGADLTLLWEPTEAMRYRNWVWRTEAYYLHKNILAPDGSGRDALNAWGAYSYFQRKVSRTTETGVRLDYYKPDVKDYANVAGLSLSPLAVTTPGARQWQVSPYVTWWQSPWVKWRLEFDHRDGKGLPDDDRLILQCTFAAGPHKHERY